MESTQKCLQNVSMSSERFRFTVMGSVLVSVGPPLAFPAAKFFSPSGRESDSRWSSTAVPTVNTGGAVNAKITRDYAFAVASVVKFQWPDNGTGAKPKAGRMT